MPELTLTALLLVGGRSTRMGSDKATLVLAGEPLWARQLRVLRELNPRELAISARERPDWCPTNISVTTDVEPSRGPLSGVAAALAGLRTTHLLVLAVDMPRMTAGNLRVVWRLAQPGRGVAPVKDGRVEGLCAIYPAEAAHIASVRLKSDEVSLHSFVAELGRLGWMELMPVGKGDEVYYDNVNTRDDFQEARRKI